MDSITLTDNQLTTLRAFINRRGFKDELVVEEILDHFACKVEELMGADPGISFEDAMTRAHKSFGVSGFLPLAQAFEKQLEQKYSLLYRQYIKKLLTTPKYLLALIPTAYLFFKGVVWLEEQHHLVFGSINFVMLIIWVVFFISQLIVLKKLGQLSSACYKKAVTGGSFFTLFTLPFIVVFVVGSIPSGDVHLNIWLIASILTLFMLIALIHQLALNSLLIKAKAELNNRLSTLSDSGH